VRGWPATCSERRCSTRIERRPRRRCLPVRHRTGWRHGWGRRRALAWLAAAQRPAHRTEGVRAVVERSAVAHSGAYPWGRRPARAAAVARGFEPEAATRRSNTVVRRATALDRGCQAGARGERWLRTTAVGPAHDARRWSAANRGCRRFVARAHVAVSAWRGVWHARWRQRADERARRGGREADRWDPVAYLFRIKKHSRMKIAQNK
jgi:hypothetical protein